MTVPELDPCIICKANADNLTAPGYDGIEMSCPSCGHFMATGSALGKIGSLSQVNRTKVVGWIYDQNELGEVPELHTDQLTWALGRPLPSFIDRIDRLLKFGIKKQERLGQKFDGRDPQIMAATYCADAGELGALRSYLHNEGYLEHVGGAFDRVTISGFLRGDELSRYPQSSTQCFVAMWFDSQMHDVYELGFQQGISTAGYDPIRVDRVEHVGKIDDEIIAQIRKSRFIVADFTGHRAGVYFEAGFALGLNLPVIWTCRKDEIAKLHFDIRQFNCIDWVEPDDLARRIQNRIEAVIGEGPRKQLASSNA